MHIAQYTVQIINMQDYYKQHYITNNKINKRLVRRPFKKI